MYRALNIIAGSLTFLLVACHQTNKGPLLEEGVSHISTDYVSKSELRLNQIEGKWYYGDEPYSGFAFRCYDNGVLAEHLGFQNGKRQGIWSNWSENGVLRIERHYEQNKLMGSYTTWWENGQLASESCYENGVLHGTQQEWYPTGPQAKKRQLANGQELGLQQAWLPNGKIYVNYEAKNGRVFGMKRANLCYQLKDGIVQN